MTPGPPPVMIVNPASPSSRAVSRAVAYTGSLSGSRAEPKMEIPDGDVAERVERGRHLVADRRHALGIAQLGEDHRGLRGEQFLVRREGRARERAG